MADNSVLPVDGGTETFANDDIGGVKYPRVKATWGPDATANDVDIATGKPMPVQVRSATGLIPIGEPTDAKSTATDTTSVSLISIAKQISASVQAATPAGTNNIGDVDVLTIAAGDNNIGNVDIVTVPADPFGADADAASATGSISAKLRGIATALGVTAFDLGSGTAGSRTLRFFKDTAQWIGGAGAVTSATQRVTLASDDPGVAAIGDQTAIIGDITDTKETDPDAASATLLELLRGLLQKTTDGIIAPGSAAEADSLSIVNPSDQGVVVTFDTSKIANAAAGTLLTPKFAAISESSSGNNEVVAAVASNKIRVLQWIVTASAAVNFKWRSASTDKTGLFYAAAAGGGAGASFNPVGHFETAVNEALNLNLSGATAVGGYVVYVEVP
jgi:hypothetical protein